jgi:Ca2+-transporting ATPase
MDQTFDVTTIRGVSTQEAVERLQHDGYNELPSAKPRSILAIAAEVVSELMFLLLAASGVIYLLVGDVQESLMLLGFVFFIMSITLYQRRLRVADLSITERSL